MVGAGSIAFVVAPVCGQAVQAVRQYDLPAQDLGTSLRAVGRISGTEIIFKTETVHGRIAPDLHGKMAASEAVDHLLSSSGLSASPDGDAIIIKRALNPEVSAASNEIVVTGSHIRGSEPVSPVIQATRRQIEDSGQSNLGDYIRSLPQNFAGGQNPGIVGGGNQGGNENLNSSSDLNLRGLGADATLTLINGHRVAYDGAVQGVDISAIPLAAVERIEIVPDGSSALYGSDAVGGVANVILRDQFDGLSTSARFGAATDGGDTEQQYDMVAGRTWTNGGFMVAGDYSRATAITAGQRSFTQTLSPSATLLPRQRQISFVGSGHQQLTDALNFLLDAQYSDRKTSAALASTTNTPAWLNGVISTPAVKTYSVTPTLSLRLPSNWRLSLSGTIGRSLSTSPSVTLSGGVSLLESYVRYDNRVKNIELDGDGPLFSLPAGEVRIAGGAGYRSLSLDAISRLKTATISLSPLNIASTQNVAYGFGELSIPLVGGANRLPLVDKLSFSAALRYEDYEGLDRIASPKLGAIYRPIPGLTIQGSWGHSFKAPTFYQRFSVFQALLENATAFGGTDTGQTALYLAGGNPDLKPERATTWTATMTARPRFVPGLTIEANYFSIRYTNRVVTPIQSSLGLFSNPLYQSLILYHPTAAQVAAAVGGAPLGLQNFSDLSYDPANVYAIVDGNLQNSAFQKTRGVDLSVSYAFDPGAQDHIDLTGTASYLDSDRRLLVTQPMIPVSGIIFFPPHWRARAGGVWRHANLTVSSFVNYTGGALDNRMLPYAPVGSYVTLDLSTRIVSGEQHGPLHNVDLLLSISNLANEKPATIRNSTVTDPTYDTTNYSAVGRAISLTLSKRW